MHTTSIANVASFVYINWAAPKPNNGGIVPPWLQADDLVPLPGPTDDEFVTLPVDPDNGWIA